MRKPLLTALLATGLVAFSLGASAAAKNSFNLC